MYDFFFMTSYDFFSFSFYKHFNICTQGHTLDRREKVVLYSCKEVRFLEVGKDVMDVREIERKEM